MKLLRRSLSFIVSLLLGDFLKKRVRMGALKAARTYILAVQFLRLGAMALFATMVGAAILVAGIVLLVGGILWLLPIRADAYPYILIGVGLLLTIGPAVIVAMVFKESRWLEVSRSYQLMELATAIAKGDESGMAKLNQELADLMGSQGPKPDADDAEVEVDLHDIAEATSVEPATDFPTSKDIKSAQYEVASFRRQSTAMSPQIEFEAHRV